MKKVIYLASVLFLFSCGSEPETVKEEVKSETIEKVQEIVEPEVEDLEEVIEEETEGFVGDAVLGETLFKDNGCVACHHASDVVIGPSLATVSEGYGDDGDKMVSFLKEEGEPIIDPDQYEVMKANLGITKAMTDDQLKAISAYILTF